MEQARVHYFSDVLCVWAYVGQVRVDELRSSFGDLIELDVHFINVFGDTRRKLEAGWSHRGGPAGYGAHVREVMERFDHVEASSGAWSECAPASSLSAHVFLRAVGLLDRDALYRACWELRRAFFVDARDVSERSVQLEIASGLGLDCDAVTGHIDSGRAHAELSADLALAREHQVRMSPSLVFNEGRQHLNGNVGYRIIEASIRELLNHPAGEASWC